MSVAASSIDAASFDFFRKLVLDRSAIALDDHKAYLVETRLAPLAKKAGLSGVAELAKRLRSTAHGSLHDQVVEAMTTNETSFFRDIHPFDALGEVVLPELIRRRSVRRTINIWSAACSSGQEPYSIAFLLQERFPELATWDVNIYATDLSEEMLKKASSGQYNQTEVNRGLPVAHLVKRFDKVGDAWIVKQSIRKTVTFQRLNLLESWSSLPTMDIVFIRNVLIYFTPDTKRTILEKVLRQLSPEGCVFLGGAETTLGLHTGFSRIPCGKTSYYRRA